MGMGRSFGVGHVRAWGAVHYLSLWKGKIVHFLHITATQSRGLLNRKMSLRTQQTNITSISTHCVVPRQTGVRWGCCTEMGLALRHSPFLVQEKPFTFGFSDSRKLRQMSRVRREGHPKGTFVWYVPPTISQGTWSARRSAGIYSCQKYWGVLLAIPHFIKAVLNLGFLSLEKFRYFTIFLLNWGRKSKYESPLGNVKQFFSNLFSQLQCRST